MRNVKRERFKEIITRRLVMNESCETIAADMGLTPQAIANQVRAFNYVKAENWELLISAINRNKSLGESAIKLSAELCGKTIPDEVLYAIDERSLRNREARKKEPETVQSNEPESEQEKKEPGTPTDGFFFIKILEALNAQNELLTQLMDVVIPKYTCDIKDCLNVNADLLCERLKSIEGHAEKVSYNTRKRGA